MNLKVGLLGLSELGLMYLKRLVGDLNCEVVFATNKFKSRPHSQVFEEEFQEICATNHIPYLGSVDANSDDVIELAKRTDICIIGGYDKILKKPFLDAPTIGTLNTHFSLLPRHRGCNPITWSLLYDDGIGYTTYLVDERIDIGRVIFWQSEDQINHLSAKSAYSLLCRNAEKNLRNTLGRVLSNELSDIPLTVPSYHGQGMPNGGWINWQWNAEFIDRFCRAMTFPPYVGARTKWNDSTYEVFHVEYISQYNSGYSPGTILQGDGWTYRVACGNGFVACTIRDMHHNKRAKGLPALAGRGSHFDSVVGKVNPIYSNGESG